MQVLVDKVYDAKTKQFDALFPSEGRATGEVLPVIFLIVSWVVLIKLAKCLLDE